MPLGRWRQLRFAELKGLIGQLPGAAAAFWKETDWSGADDDIF